MKASTIACRRGKRRPRARFLGVLLALALAACATRREPPPSSARTAPVDMIVIHAVSGPFCDGDEVVFTGAPERRDDARHWRRFIESQDDVSIHYVIGRGGDIEASVPERRRAWHAGPLNDRSIGIELVHRGDGEEPFSRAQMDALTRLVRALRRRHDVPLAHIVTHGDVDQRTCTCGGQPFRRRIDPGPNFPLDALRAAVARPGETVGEASFTPRAGVAPDADCDMR